MRNAIMNKKQENKVTEVLQAINDTIYVQDFNFKIEKWDADMYREMVRMTVMISRNDNSYKTDTVMWAMFINENGSVISYRNNKKVGSGMIEVKGLKKVINECATEF